MRVFVTGGTGLIGSHVIAELRTHGHDVVALHRRGVDTLFLQENEAELVQGDIRDDAEVLSKLMEGCTNVVHAAALVYADGAWPKVRSVNVDGTRNVLTAARLAGVGHVVYISSVAVYGTVEGPVDEDSPTDSDLPPEDLYARSKREAEEVVRGIEDMRGLPVTVVRPSAVYGERDRLMAPALADILRLPVVPVLGGGHNTLPVVYAGNVAVAVRLAVEASRGHTTYNLAYDHDLTQRELFEMLAAGMGKAPRLVSVPAKVVQGGSGVLARLGVTTPGAKHLPLDRVTRLALGDNPYRSERARSELGWDPPYEHREALERTGRWLLKQN